MSFILGIVLNAAVRRMSNGVVKVKEHYCSQKCLPFLIVVTLAIQHTPHTLIVTPALDDDNIGTRLINIAIQYTVVYVWVVLS